MYFHLRALVLCGALLVAGRACWGDPPTLDERLDAAIAHAAATLDATATSGMLTNQYPRNAPPGGDWQLVDPGYWVTGHFVGALWTVGDLLGDAGFHDYARDWGAAVGPQYQNIGFTTYLVHRPWYDHDGGAVHRNAVITAAENHESNFAPLPDANGQNPGARGIFSYDYDHSGWKPYYQRHPDWAVAPVDHMMDLQATFWAARETGDTALYDKSVLHARTVADYWARPDGGTVHWGFVHRTTGVFESSQYQGYQEDTAWSRGQAWTLYGLTVAAREAALAGEDADAQAFLADVGRLADYWFARVPPDGVPVWDLDLPPGVPADRDSSAAAIVASAFVELGRLAPQPADRRGYLAAAEVILESLATPKAEGGYLNLDAYGDPDGSGVLAHGVYVHDWCAAAGNDPGGGKGQDHALIWGDYYFLEAIQRYKELIAQAEPGDANLDGCVDGLDYNFWSVHYLDQAVPAWGAGGRRFGNFNSDAIVDGLDYNIWSLNYLSGCGAGSEVPEPAFAALLVVGLCIVVRRRQTQR